MLKTYKFKNSIFSKKSPSNHYNEKLAINFVFFCFLKPDFWKWQKNFEQLLHSNLFTNIASLGSCYGVCFAYNGCYGNNLETVDVYYGYITMKIFKIKFPIN